MKKKVKQEIKKELKPKIVPLVIGILIILAGLAFFFFDSSESTPWIILSIFVLLGIMLIFIAFKGKARKMSSEEWIYMGILFFMIGTIIDSLTILRTLGFIYFVVGLMRKQIEKKNMNETQAKRLIFWIMFGLLLLFILGMVVFMIIN